MELVVIFLVMCLLNFLFLNLNELLSFLFFNLDEEFRSWRSHVEKYKKQLEESKISNENKVENIEQIIRSKNVTSIASLPEFYMSKSTKVFKTGIIKPTNNFLKMKKALHFTSIFFTYFLFWFTIKQHAWF